MSIESFIERYRKEIDAYIRRVCDNCELDDEDREDWIANDEHLYTWAQEEGVEV